MLIGEALKEVRQGKKLSQGDIEKRPGLIQGKFILRTILERHIPREWIERPKMGFGVPIGSWLRGPLRDSAESLLSESALRRDAILAPNPIRALWDDHLSGRNDWSDRLWTGSGQC